MHKILYVFQFLGGISTSNEVYFYSVPELRSLVLPAEETCELVQGDPNFVGNFTLTFSLLRTLVHACEQYDCIILL